MKRAYFFIIIYCVLTPLFFAKFSCLFTNYLQRICPILLQKGVFCRTEKVLCTIFLFYYMEVLNY